MNATKRMIMKSFQKLYNHYGYKKTTMDDLAEDCGISKKTIYSNFNSKEEIYSAIVAEKGKMHREKMAMALEASDGFSNKIRHLIEMIFEENRKWIERGNSAFEFKNKYEIAIQALELSYERLFYDLISNASLNNEISIEDIELQVRFTAAVIKEAMRIYNTSCDESLVQYTVEAVEKMLI